MLPCMPAVVAGARHATAQCRRDAPRILRRPDGRKAVLLDPPPPREMAARKNLPGAASFESINAPARSGKTMSRRDSNRKVLQSVLIGVPENRTDHFWILPRLVSDTWCYLSICDWLAAGSPFFTSSSACRRFLALWISRHFPEQ